MEIIKNAHQYIEQMPEEVRAAVFGNVGTMVTFRVGAFDAEVLEKEFFPTFTKEDLVNLGFVQIYLKLMIDGVTSQPFSARTLPPIAEPAVSFKEDIINFSREQFAKPRAEVEKNIRDWHMPINGVPLSRPAQGHALTSASTTGVAHVVAPQQPSQHQSPAPLHSPQTAPAKIIIPQASAQPHPQISQTPKPAPAQPTPKPIIPAPTSHLAPQSIAPKDALRQAIEAATKNSTKNVHPAAPAPSPTPHSAEPHREAQREPLPPVSKTPAPQPPQQQQGLQ